jgi:hypothetical protein
MTHPCRRAQACGERHATYEDADHMGIASSNSKVLVITGIISTLVFRQHCACSQKGERTQNATILSVMASTIHKLRLEISTSSIHMG